MRPCTRRIASAEDVVKATSLDDVLVEHAPWCRTAPATLLIRIKPLALFPVAPVDAVLRHVRANGETDRGIDALLADQLHEAVAA